MCVCVTCKYASHRVFLATLFCRLITKRRSDFEDIVKIQEEKVCKNKKKKYKEKMLRARI